METQKSSQSDLTRFASLLSTESGLLEVITIRDNGTPLVSIVNAALIPHPATGEDVIAFVSLGSAVRLRHLRKRPQISVAARRGHDWSVAEGMAELAGPNDQHEAVGPGHLAQLLREIFVAAGGQHDDFDQYDAAMADQQRCAVLVTPARFYGNPK